MMLAEKVLNAAREKGWKITAAESCTGGMVASALTDVPGSSDVFGFGFVTYSNKAKEKLLGVPLAWCNDPAIGAVSEKVAIAMAEGAVKAAGADIAVAITGVAGPGQSENKPAGLVHIAVVAADGKTTHRRHQFAGNRPDVRKSSVEAALTMLLDALK